MTVTKHWPNVASKLHTSLQMRHIQVLQVWYSTLILARNVCVPPVPTGTSGAVRTSPKQQRILFTLYYPSVNTLLGTF